MSELSPATQAVLKAYRSSHLSINNLSAAIRAAADQASPEKQVEDIQYAPQSYTDGMRDALAVLQEIADELEAQ
jgi:hypothetical protein